MTADPTLCLATPGTCPTCYTLLASCIDVPRDGKTVTEWITLKGAAQLLKMGKSTVNKLARENRMPAHKVGREWRFDASLMFGAGLRLMKRL